MKKLSDGMILFGTIVVAFSVLFIVMISAEVTTYHQGEEVFLPSPEQDPCLHCHIAGSEPNPQTPTNRWIAFGSMGLIFLFGITRNLSVWKTRELWHHRWMLRLGRIIAVVFLVQIVAGIILVLFAKPMPEALIDTPVSFDFVIRAIHWGSGIILFITTSGFSFIGSLIPGNQRAFWATVFGVEIIGGLFAISELSLAYLRADWVITLSPSRLYALHMLLIPVVVVSILGVYLTVMRKQDTQ